MVKTTLDLPYHGFMGDASYGARVFYTNMTFTNFPKTKTWCGSKISLFELNNEGSDYIPRAQFSKITFDNVHEDNIAFLMDPNPGWANSDDCGNWPCSAPSNALL
jgi:hypothetical protein